MLRQFRVAFATMAVIPLGIGVYILAARLFTLEIFKGLTGLYFVLALLFILLGFLLGRQILHGILGRLIDASVQLRQYEVVKSGFIASVAYELGPPLAAVQLSLKNCSDGLMGPLTDGQQTAVQECQRIVTRLTALAADLIDITDEARKRPRARWEVLEVGAVIRAAAHQCEPTLLAHRLKLSLELPPRAALFFGDQRLFLQAFERLFAYAVRWSADGGVIRVEVAYLPQEIRVALSHGIAAERADAFPLGERAAPLLGPDEMGLGLEVHLVREIVELHHGRLWVERTSAGEGRCLMSLPVVDPGPGR